GGRRVTTAVVVARDGRLVAERYAPGYGPDAPMLSWSMAKSVLATLVGLAIEEERLALDASGVAPEWRGAADARRFVTLDQMLRMSSGLHFDETYGPTSEASVMLFARPEAAAYAAAMPLAAPPDSVWSYSSGTSNLLARALRESFAGDTLALLDWADQRLFSPAGITTALLETDAGGNLLASSFVYMTARDWARFGELHRLKGRAQGRRVLPEGWVDYVTTPTPASHGEYGAHWWLNRGQAEAPDTPTWPALPRDTYAARGHNGQYVVVVPSEKLVVVRLGLTTPDGGHDGAAELVADVIRAYRQRRTP
ncbi:MAG: serine hydrolase, partial [Myxococcales bacterium]|nr:serine hydrolase [Myxococcales bacterium]